METELQAARVLLYTAASKLDRKAPDAGKWSAMAKRFVTDAGFNVANDALQLLAAMAICTITASRSWCATCASTRSSKAPTRSCASSSPAHLIGR